MSGLARLDGGVLLREASADDVPVIVALHTDDPLGATRESADLAPYRAAFAAVDADPAHLLVVAEDGDGTVVGTLQLSFLPGLSRGGASRALVEGVRVAAGLRSQGIGARLKDTLGRQLAARAKAGTMRPIAPWSSTSSISTSISRPTLSCSRAAEMAC